MTNEQPSPHRPTITIARCSRKEQNWACNVCEADWLPEVFVIESDTGYLWCWLCPACLGQLADAANDTLERSARNLEREAS